MNHELQRRPLIVFFLFFPGGREGSKSAAAAAGTDPKNGRKSITIQRFGIEVVTWKEEEGGKRATPLLRLSLLLQSFSSHFLAVFDRGGSGLFCCCCCIGDGLPKSIVEETGVDVRKD
jgi:hypothetical protein